ncbi:MAG: hypothetical protein IH991_23580, partial [Planctomycetes bacterium]|nr:hypothetical protein [Planctomycetota bacterium]
MLMPVRCQRKVLYLLFALLLVSPQGLFAQAKKPQTAKESLKKKVETCQCGEAISVLSDSDRVAEAKILNALEDETSMAFNKTPLSEAIEFLKDYHKIEIHLDAKALEDAGIESDTPVTRNIKGITLRSALKLMLRDLDLTFIIKDEILQITTPEVAENFNITKIYPAHILLVDPDNDAEHGEASYDYQSLIALITST